MRTLAKSFFRLTWVMSVFGLQQVSTVLKDLQSDDETSNDDSKVAAALDAVSSDTQKHLEKRTRALADAGDRLQSELVDLIFDTVRPDEWRPRRVAERAARLAERSADGLREWAKEVDTDADGEREPAAAS